MRTTHHNIASIVFFHSRLLLLSSYVFLVVSEVCPGKVDVYVSNVDTSLKLKNIHGTKSYCSFLNESEIFVTPPRSLSIAVSGRNDSFGYNVNFDWIVELKLGQIHNTSIFPGNYSIVMSSNDKVFCEYTFCTDIIKNVLLQRSAVLHFYYTYWAQTDIPNTRYSLNMSHVLLSQSTPTCDSEQIRNSNIWPYVRVIGSICGDDKFLKLEYRIPEQFRKKNMKKPFKHACKNEMKERISCNITELKQTCDENGTFNLHISQELFDHHIITLGLWGNSVLKDCTISVDLKEAFEDCNKDSSTIVSIISCVSVFLIIVIAVILFFGFKTHWNLAKFWLLFRPPPNAPGIITVDVSKIKLFIIYSADHRKHEDVILKFAAFLEKDLQFTVILDLYDQEQIHSDPLGWLDKSLRTSDKVLVIWSPCAERKYESFKQNYDQMDLFSLALMNIKRDFIRCKEMDKYYFGYFNYCSETDVPNDFKEYDLTNFVLMKEFESLYFQLTKLQEEHPGKRLKQENASFDCLFDPEVNSFGPALDKAINEMTVFVNQNPQWFESANTDNSVSPSTHCPEGISYVMYNSLDVVPPSEIEI